MTSSVKMIQAIKSEYFFWALVACFVSGRFILAIYGAPPEFLPKLINEYYFEVLVGVMLLVFPLLFLQVFGSMPFEAFRNRKKVVKSEQVQITGDKNVIHIAESQIQEKLLQKGELSTQVYLHQLVEEAGGLSQKIYNRSGVYLMFGILIAFSGIFYFSISPVEIPKGTTLSETILLLAPRFGILFFIEFIAFFFLKQYRSAMDEFRHYDRLKRNRESQLTIVMMAMGDFEEIEFSKVVKEMAFFERSGVLANGETTEIIESQKLNNAELDALKVIAQDAVKAVKP